MYNKIKSTFGMTVKVLFFLVISMPLYPIAPIGLDDFEFIFSGNFKPETFFGSGVSRLNTIDDLDKIFFSRHTLDINMNILYGNESYGHDAAQFYFTLRNKAVWGSPENLLRTTDSTVKLLEAVQGAHTHGIPRHLFWMREAWLQFELKDVFGLSCTRKHSLKIGAFPYELGRGIALGDAYAVGPELLGFYSDGAVDQYAYGALLTNEFITDTLFNEIYVAILQNKCSTPNEVNLKIRGQEFGRLNSPERGFGRINFLTATRFNWIVFNDTFGKLNVEAYALYNNDKEQKVEFAGDASARFGTVGFASEYVGPVFEVGFDTAFNIGNQELVGWDRNGIILENRGGSVFIVNDHVRVGDPITGQRALYVDRSEVQNAVNNAYRDASFNGKQIGVTSDGQPLFNAVDRFRNPTSRKLKGWMFVSDAGWWILEKELQVAVAGGIASGEDNPINDQYTGFVGLQELYAGKRVKSAFLLGGAGKVKRFLSQPDENADPDRYITSPISGFTNLIYTGASLSWGKKNVKKPFKLNPNVLVYWQETRTGHASNYLGVESNLFATCNILRDLELFCVGSVFFPGTHYKDRKGAIAVTPEQEDIVDEADVTGYEADPIPRYNDNIAFTLNIGLKFSF